MYYQLLGSSSYHIISYHICPIPSVKANRPHQQHPTLPQPFYPLLSLSFHPHVLPPSPFSSCPNYICHFHCHPRRSHHHHHYGHYEQQYLIPIPLPRITPVDNQRDFDLSFCSLCPRRFGSRLSCSSIFHLVYQQWSLMCGMNVDRKEMESHLIQPCLLQCANVSGLTGVRFDRCLCH